jgi:Protein of unknown function (DUF2878)
MTLNFVLSMLAWVACVWGIAHGRVWPGVIATVAITALHLWFTRHRWREEARLIARVTLMGVPFDAVLMGLGAWAVPRYPGVNATSMLWMTSLWIGFATTYTLSMRCFTRWHLGWSALIGAVFGPIAYWSGARIGAVEYGWPFWCVAMLQAIQWGGLLAIGLLLTRVLIADVSIERGVRNPPGVWP